MKKTAAFVLAVLMISMVSCGKNKETEESISEESSVSESSEASEIAAETKTPPKAAEVTEKWEQGYLPQANEPSKDSPYVTFHTNMGEIKMVLYPEAAPLTVENFITHCKDGYYDKLTFHRVIDDFMIQGGDPKGNGTGGESIWNSPFMDEPNRHLYNFRGALCMANAGTYTNGSQFFIVQQGLEKPVVTDENMEQYLSQMFFNEISTKAYTRLFDYKYFENPTEEEFNSKAKEISDEANAQLAKGPTDEDKADMMGALAHYKEVGGTPHLDFKHTVFGQVVEGMDIVDKIAKVAKNEFDAPKDPVIIERVTVWNAPVYSD